MTTETATQPTFDPVLARAKALTDALWNDAKAGPLVRAKAKELYPEIVIPEDQIEPMMAPVREQLDAYKAEITKLQEERAAERQAAAEATQQLNMRSALDGARAKYNLTDEGLDQMVERMKSTGNYADAEAAAAWVVQNAPPPPKPNPAWVPQDMNLFGSKDGDRNDEKLALLHRDPERYRDNEIMEFFKDPDRYVAETFGQAA